MADNKTYRIDESALRKKFADYRVSFNPACLQLLESEISQVKTHAHLEMPKTKNLVKFIAIPLVLLALGCLAFFSYNYINNLPSASTTKDTVNIARPIIQPKIETPKPEVKPKVVVADTITKYPKKDTVITEVEVPKIKNIKTLSTQKNSSFKKDTLVSRTIIKTQPDSVKKRNKTDTTSLSKNRDTSSKKKKKKRKNSLDATEDIRQSAPNSADDDVVVPNN